MLPLRQRHPSRAVHEPLLVPLPSLPAGAALGSALVSDEPVRLTAFLHGRVQGVGMRWWVRSRALELGLVGWARNTDDGRVEVVAEGARAAAERLLSLLREGNPPGKVSHASERWAPAVGGLSGFQER